MKEYLIKIFDDGTLIVRVLSEADMFAYVQENYEKPDDAQEKFSVAPIGDCILDFS